MSHVWTLVAQLTPGQLRMIYGAKLNNDGSLRTIEQWQRRCLHEKMAAVQHWPYYLQQMLLTRPIKSDARYSLTTFLLGNGIDPVWIAEYYSLPGMLTDKAAFDNVEYVMKRYAGGSYDDKRLTLMQSSVVDVYKDVWKNGKRMRDDDDEPVKVFSHKKLVRHQKVQIGDTRPRELGSTVPRLVVYRTGEVIYTRSIAAHFDHAITMLRKRCTMLPLAQAFEGNY